MDERKGKMTQERMVMGPMGTRMWHAHMKGWERENRILGNVHWGRVVHENGKRVMAF